MMSCLAFFLLFKDHMCLDVCFGPHAQMHIKGPLSRSRHRSIDTARDRREFFGLTGTSGSRHASQAESKTGGAKGGTEGYDNKLYRKFENDRDSAPEDRGFMREFYYRRRHLATGINQWQLRTLKYEVEVEEIKQAVHDGLKAIKERESAEIINEVSSDLLFDVLHSIDCFRGGLPKSWRSLMNKLRAEGWAKETRAACPPS
jgi:hypothetical protein